MVVCSDGRGSHIIYSPLSACLVEFLEEDKEEINQCHGKQEAVEVGHLYRLSEVSQGCTWIIESNVE